jgi:transposase-like protein
VPNLSKGTPVIVTDREPGIAKALKNYLSNCKHVFCWNHIKRDVVHWLKTHNAVQDDISVYTSVNRFINEFMLSTILFVTPEYGS